MGDWGRKKPSKLNKDISDFIAKLSNLIMKQNMIKFVRNISHVKAYSTFIESLFFCYQVTNIIPEFL